MSAGFTPGPWIVTGATFEGCVDEECGFIVSADEMTICAANANLIAAAPALYEALEAMISKLGPDGYYPLAGKPLTDKARAALAQARGDLVNPSEQVRR